MSLAYNTEAVALLLPHLNSLSGLPTALKRYEPATSRCARSAEL